MALEDQHTTSKHESWCSCKGSPTWTLARRTSLELAWLSSREQTEGHCRQRHSKISWSGTPTHLLVWDCAPIHKFVRPCILEVRRKERAERFPSHSLIAKVQANLTRHWRGNSPLRATSLAPHCSLLSSPPSSRDVQQSWKENSALQLEEQRMKIKNLRTGAKSALPSSKFCTDRKHAQEYSKLNFVYGTFK